ARPDPPRPGQHGQIPGRFSLPRHRAPHPHQAVFNQILTTSHNWTSSFTMITMKTPLQSKNEELEQRLVNETEPTVASQVSPEEIVRMFSSRDAEERARAELALEDLGPAATEALLTVVQDENSKLKSQRKRRTRILGGGIGILVLSPVIYGLVTGNWDVLS